MKFNIFLVKDKLPEATGYKVVYTHLEGQRLDCPLQGALLYGNTLPKVSYLAIMEAEEWNQLKERTEGGSYLIVGWNIECEKPEGCSYIGIQDKVAVQDVLLKVSDLFAGLQQWETDLYEAVMRKESLKALGNLTLPYLTNPICMYTPSHQLVFYSEHEKSKQLMLFNNDEDSKRLSSDEVEGLRFNPDFIDTIAQTEPQIFPDEFWGYRILYDNIRINDIYIARIMACETERPIQDSDYLILRRLAQIMAHALEGQDWTVNGHPLDFDESIRILVQGGIPNEEKLTNALDELGWKTDDIYFCAQIPLTEEDRQFHSVTTICSTIESSLQCVRTILLKNSFLALFNLSRSDHDRNESISFMIYVLREYLMPAGISTRFKNIKRLFFYYKQAEYAYLYGHKYDPTLWYYRYEHYEYDHLLNNALGDMDLDSICPPGLHRLIIYDTEHNRDYANALKVYLEENMSVMAAVRKLYMQKSTFIYQLKRIQEITGENFENKETRFLYLMYFKMRDLRK